MIFKEDRFPEDISYGSIGGPEFSSTINELENGEEYHNIHSCSTRMKYNIYYTTKSDQKLLKLLSFFYECRGKLTAFRFKDWLDYKAMNQLIAIGDGKNEKFQLVKTYGKTNSHKRIITKPVVNTVNIYLNNKLQTEGFSIDYTSGKIEFALPLKENSILTADFEFDVPVRFNTNALMYSITGFKQNNCNVQLIEVKV